MLHTFLSQRDFRRLRMSQRVVPSRKVASLKAENVTSHKCRERQEITHPVALCHRKIKSGEGEIRTPGGLPHAGFQDRCNRPLCHLSGRMKHALFLLLPVDFCRFLTPNRNQILIKISPRRSSENRFPVASSPVASSTGRPWRRLDYKIQDEAMRRKDSTSASVRQRPEKPCIHLETSPPVCDGHGRCRLLLCEIVRIS